MQLKYFKIEEFKCPCCGLNNMDVNLLIALDLLRERCKFPFAITSGCRCVSHNMVVGGKSDSAHTPDKNGVCHAVDIQVPTSGQRFIFLDNLKSVNIIKRIGIANSFIHIDNHPDLPQNVCWLYPSGGSQ